jgi:hypothetical protein
MMNRDILIVKYGGRCFNLRIANGDDDETTTHALRTSHLKYCHTR